MKLDLFKLWRKLGSNFTPFKNLDKRVYRVIHHKLFKDICHELGSIEGTE